MYHFWHVGLCAKAKAKASDSYIARLTRTKPDQPRFTIIGSGSWSARVNGAAAVMRPSIECANEQLDPRQQLANTPPPERNQSCQISAWSVQGFRSPGWPNICGNRYLALTGGIALTTVYVLTCYTVISIAQGVLLTSQECAVTAENWTHDLSMVSATY